ncbi:MAG: tetratricopeptide repeat protein [Anaerolineae bacterium]
MYGFTYVRQGWNDCGPANITMALSHFGWRETQEYAASILKPNTEDKNVSPSEMVSFVRQQTQVSAITRMGGDIELVKDFIAANIPIIVETGYYLEGENWLGHYQTVVGYDDNQSVFYIYDSWLGIGTGDAGIAEHYSDFDANWQYFNRAFIVIYEKDRENVVQQILGDRADVTKADEHALAVAQQEARADRQNALAWFNLGTSYTRLGQYEQAATAYDQARRLGTLPFRMLWYQFGPFEAYFETGRYDDVLALVNTNLRTAGNYVEETFYWQGKVLAAQGQRQDAAAAFQRAIAQNPNYQAARDALGTLNL